MVINNAKADTSYITTRVPHGSILGPLHLIIFINDLPNASNLFHSIMYADLTNLSASLQSSKYIHTNETVYIYADKQ